MMNTSDDTRNPVELLAEEFLDRKRRGEHPTLREYADRHPDLAAEIQDLFPALLMVENLGESSGAETGSLAADNGVAVGIRLERLGDYRILREIGRGGMGVVYEAEQESLGRRVALKVLSAGSLLDPKQVRRFEREAKAAAKLHHTNIVPVFGVGRQDGHHYFVMQFIAGLGLDVVLDDLRRLRRAKSVAGPDAGPAPATPRLTSLTAADVARSLLTGRFAADGPPADGSMTEPIEDAAPPVANGPPSDSGSSPAILPGSSELSASSDPDRQFYRGVARIGLQVAEALEYANNQGILHRDVKPSNLLLDNHGNVWVADFGLAKTAEADDLTHTGDILGTIRYMAPERFSGHCDARSDVYSLGLTLYELVALEPAYEASDRPALIERVLHEDPERLKKLVPGVARDLETIVAKATARDPAARYATAAALADDLRRFVEDRPIRARRISAAERLVRWCRRNKSLAAAIGVAVVAMVAAVVLSLLYADRQRRHAAELADANGRITGLAADLANESGVLKAERSALKNERSRLASALAESKSRLARLNLERGQAAFEKGKINVGMLWTVESLRMAAAADDEAGKRVALANLAAWRRYVSEPKRVFLHDADVRSVAFSPDGKTILTGSWDKTARLWDAATGKPIGQPLAHPNIVKSAVFSPDGKTILTGCLDSTARLWDAATGQPIGEPMAHPSLVTSTAFSPDGKTILTGCTNVARLWNAATGQPIGQPIVQPGLLLSAAFSPDGKTILTGGGDNSARRWLADTGRPLGEPLVHGGPVTAVAFSPDGKTIVTGGGDSTARLWIADTGQPIGPPLVHSDTVSAVAFNPTSTTILTGCHDGTARLWDAANAQPMGRPLEHQGGVWSVAFSPDGKTILSGGLDGTARLWDAEVFQSVGRVLEFGCQLDNVAFGADGKTLVVLGYDGNASIRDAESGRRLGQPAEQGPVNLALALSPDARRILTAGADRMVRLWDAFSGRPIGRPIAYSSEWIRFAFHPDGKTIVTNDASNTARLWDAASGRPIGKQLVHSEPVFCMAFSPDGKTILTGSLDRTARLWDVETSQPIRQPMVHPGRIWSVAFSPDGKTILTGCQDKIARLWDTVTGRPVGQPLIHQGWVMSAAFSPDGKTIVTGCSDKTARMWDAASCQPIGPPMPHSNSVKGLAFSADGRFLLTDESIQFMMRQQLWAQHLVRQWDAPPALPDDLPRLSVWVETITGLELDEQGSVRVLDREAWLERHGRLESLGGPPPPDPAPRRDPILFGLDPAARGDALLAQGHSDRAEAAYAEAARAQPLDRSIRNALVRLHAERGHLARAVETVALVVRRMPDDPELRGYLGVTLLASGDRSGWRRSNTILLDRFGGTHSAFAAYQVASACVLGPDATADPDVPVRLAELALRGASEDGKPNYLSTLGATLYRAGRFDEAIRRLDDGIKLRGGTSFPWDWPFLAMAHHRLGHRDLARRWLDRLREYQPSADRSDFWDEWELRLLRSEAEAVILYDPIFPADPFAH